jgi:hypothetical protein
VKSGAKLPNRPDPSVLEFGLATFWLIFLPLLGILYMMVPTSPDQALFDYIAWMKINGAPYYKGAAEQNWPGEIFLHELGIRLFGVHFWTYRLIDFIVMQFGAVGIFLFLRRSGLLLAPFIVLAIYPIVYVTAGYWMAGQRDIVAAEFLLGASAFLIGPARIFDGMLAGSLIAFAVLIRPTYFSFLCGVLLLDWFGLLHDGFSNSRRVRRAVPVISGFVLLVGAVILAGWLIGSLNDWYEQTILFNLQGYSSNVPARELGLLLANLLIRSWHWMALFAVLGFALWLFRRGLRAGQLLVFGLVATIILSYFIQGKGFGYHLGGLIPVFVLLIAVFLEELSDLWGLRDRRRLAVGVVTIVVIVVTVVGTGKKATALVPQLRMLTSGEFQPVFDGSQSNILSWQDTRAIVDRIQAESAANEYFFQWGRNFEIGYLAQRRSTTRFVNTPMLDLISNRFEAWLAEFDDSLSAKPPVLILVERSFLDNINMPLSIPNNASQAFRILIAKINAGYRIIMVNDKIALFEATNFPLRQGLGSPASLVSCSAKVY